MSKRPERDPVNGEQWQDDGSADVMPGEAARPNAGEPIQSVIRRAISRRALLRGGVAAGATLVIAPAALLNGRSAMAATAENPHTRLTFQTVPPGNEPDVVVPPNYVVDVVLRWGDPLTPSAPAFDVDNQSAAAQAQQFGFNADLVLFYPLPQYVKNAVQQFGSPMPATHTLLGAQYPILKNRPTRRALVVVNHEYTSGADMFPLYEEGNPTQDQVEVEIEAHGFSVVELVKGADKAWSFDIDSPFNRRVTGSTPIEISGPLRGHPMLQTSADPAGTTVLGCLNNCAGGKTPWGTILTCEENFDQYFANFDDPTVPAEVRAVSERIPAPGGASERLWEAFDPRFDLAQEPQEYNRFGYIVEIDPYDPTAVPKKRTALGRFKHEGAAARIAGDGRVVVYSGDDARFEYVYKFVSAGRYRRFGRAANMDLLDDGTLFVARFDAGDVEGDEMGSGVWLPLVWEPGNALDQAGFTSQAHVLLDTRRAADVLGATPMDRPEDIEISPQTSKVYIALTNNSRRTEPNEANPRIDNEHGHIIELIEDDDDATAATFTWNILVKCGDPAVPGHDTRFADIADPVGVGVSPISDPDNLVHDDDGNLWIATDGQYFSGSDGFGQNDGIFAVPVEGPARGWLRQFLSGVPGGEVCGPEFSGDNRTFFCAIQHPNDGEAFEKIWPIGDADVSKPSLIAVREVNGRKIGR
ncbi:MAG: PhoX family phosphatase [Chromatiaceae bacterium]|nr:PhoX family phosphatase [Chromatiaceae bacterium]MCP5313885.1 PhoX family phosphatase [Chromatiaceae bacterium]